MEINVELLFNQEKANYSLLDLNSGFSGMMPRDGAETLLIMFKNIKKTFQTRKELNKYVAEINKQL